ncbi:MAG: VWA domain-containing protein [Planctomycetaceae bacterium]|jgi:Mg-chelatase subunit ChlD|nr:VWA domain-containing protein [Planctomycetaceae bacterium]
MIEFEVPALLLLGLPLGWAYWQWFRVSGATGWLRAGLLGLLVVALAGPRWDIGGDGLDVILVVDRSRSVSAENQAAAVELIADLENTRGAGDRLAVVTLGGEPRVEQELSHDKTLGGEFARVIDPDGSDLAASLTTSLNLVDPRRPARVLVLSDGESNGSDPLSAARRAREAGVPIDFRLFERLRVGDAAVEAVRLPMAVAPREPFQFSVWIASDGERSGTVRVLRDGELLAKTSRRFRSGRNRLLFRDILESGGVHRYSVELETANDPVVENNRGSGVVRVEAGPRLLLLTGDGKGGNLLRALQAADLPVDLARAAAHPLTLDALDGYRAVIIENTPADDLGRLKMARLAQYVEELGGGLLLTGGERSFGQGGYFKSPLDDVLPVSMELREEHRKLRVAMAIVLDRSGSMAVPVAGGKTKMDLANLGTAECVRLLSRSDKVSVIAVDSSPHVIQPLIEVTDPAAIASRALKIESMGGGIFVYEALVAAGKELGKAGDYSTRHILLFSDAADSEQPGNYKQLLENFEKGEITVSVIGLGTETDPDAELLKDIARRGRGNIMFSTDPQELPRLFAQDTISVARNTFIKKDGESQAEGIAGAFQPGVRLLGDLGEEAFPRSDGYNLCYIKPDATTVVASEDEYQAPWSAAWYRGLGRAVAITLEVDGKFSGEFGRWDGYADFLVTHTRWLLSGAGELDEVFVEMIREGQDAVVRVELDPERAAAYRLAPPRVLVIPPGRERQEPLEPDLAWTGPNSLEARVRLARTGTYRTLVRGPDRQFARGPVVTLPYSPEFVPRIDLPSGGEVLAEVALISEGRQRTDVTEIYADPPRSSQRVSLLPWLFVASMVVLVMEIAGRRLNLWSRSGERFTRSATGKVVAPSRPKPAWRSRRGSSPVSADRPADPSPARVVASADTVEPSTPDRPAAADVFRQAKSRARRRLK